MSGTDDWYRSLHEEKCQSKRRFLSAQSARAAVEQEGLRRRKTLFYYRCPTCTKFHLTKNDPKDYDLRAFVKSMHQLLTGGHVTRQEHDEAIRRFKLQQERR